MSVSRKNATKRDKQQSLIDMVSKQEIVKSDSAISLAPSTAEIQGIIYRETSGKQFTESDKNITKKYRKYYNAKVVALNLEEVNNSKLILFPSIGEGEEGEWYKMGGNSALFYKNIVGPRMGRKKIKIRRDSDMNHRFKSGVAAIHWKNKFIEDMVKTGYDKFEENELGMLFFDLGVKFSDREIATFREAEKREAEKFNLMVIPKNDYPDLYGLFLQLARLLPPKIKRMHPAYREMFQREFIENLMIISKSYTKMANGDVAKEIALENILDAIDNLLAILAIVSEGGIFDVMECARMGSILTDLKSVAKKRLEDVEGSAKFRTR